jgi:drug/metabolite transporter (DMT)-like permease
MRGEAHLSFNPTKLRRLGRERCEGATMTKAQMAIVLVIALSCVGVVADAVLKLASSQREVILSKWLFVGVALSCVFAIGWVFLMRVMKLATAGVIYGVTSAVLLCLIGVIFFGEKLSPLECAGVATATLAIIMLSYGPA